MSRTIIQVEHLSKAYRVGVEERKADTLAGAFWQALTAPVRNFRNLRNLRNVSEDEETLFWALRDVSFEVKEGEVLGIIGHNGAGKSTLLKILSRITEPTEGRITIHGRVSSLLEVGTGFHPDLTGRENIYMNGTILGMRKKEIDNKLEEIIAFSGISRHIDTPVKRYSSGMTVRLAFSVAAHLDPEILVIDEVLAVGDAEFQKKAVGRMREVSKGRGRTVLFVSHNMEAVKNLCSSAILLSRGKIEFMGVTNSVIKKYVLSNKIESWIREFNSPDVAPGNEYVKVKRMALVPKYDSGSDLVTVTTPIEIEFEFWNRIVDKSLNLSLHVYTIDGTCVFNCVSEIKLLKLGVQRGVCLIPGNLLNATSYFVTMMIVADSSTPIYHYEDGLMLEVHENRVKSAWHGKWPGVLRPKLKFTLETVG